MLHSRRLPSWAIVAVVLWSCGINWGQAESAIVINELHTNPDVKTELVEFIELYNAGTAEVDLSGWQFTEGVLYTFPAGTKLPAGGYIIVAQSPDGHEGQVERGPDCHSRESHLRAVDGRAEQRGRAGRSARCGGGGGGRGRVPAGVPVADRGRPGVDTQPGTGSSMQLVNPAFDNDLGGSWRSALPTPAAANTGVLTDNIPPQVRQVKHSPKQPKSGEVVTITAKITDPDGVGSVSLLYQLVNPGAYIARFDPQYCAGLDHAPRCTTMGWTATPGPGTTYTRCRCRPGCRRTAAWSATGSL